MPSHDKKLRVVCFNGGGIRSVLSTTILEFVEQHLGRPIHECADVICGTSAGGLVALALTKPSPLSAQQCSQLFIDHGAEIFSRSYYRAAYTLNTFSGPKYDGLGLARVVADTFGDARLGQSLTPTFVTSYNLTTRAPALHRSWLADDARIPVSDLALATSAAPTYFPPHKVDGAFHCDGGTVCNNPSLSGVIEACKLHGRHTRDCSVLSIGTGICKQPLAADKARGWGKIGWVAPLIDVMLDGVPDLTAVQMADLMPDGQYLHLDPVLSTSLAALDNAKPSQIGQLQAIGKKVIDLQKDSLVALLDQW